MCLVAYYTKWNHFLPRWQYLKAPKNYKIQRSLSTCASINICQSQERISFWNIFFNSSQISVSLKTNSLLSAIQFNSVAQSGPNLCDPMDSSMPGLHAHHQLLEFTQTHVCWVGGAIQPSHPLSSSSPPAFNLSKQGLLKRISSSYQVVKVLEFQLQQQSFQWTLRTDLL